MVPPKTSNIFRYIFENMLFCQNFTIKVNGSEARHRRATSPDENQQQRDMHAVE
jgi:hypothetical protein